MVRLFKADWVASSAFDVSEDGRVVGTWEAEGGSGESGEMHVFLWEAGTVVDLTDLGVAQSGWFANDDRLIVGLADGTHAVYRTEAGTFEPYELDVPRVDPPLGFTEAEVQTANRRGEAVGVLYPKSADNMDGVRGFVASGGDVIVLDPAPGGDTSVAWWINDAGQVVGGPARDEDERVLFTGRAFLYDLRTGQTTDLGTLSRFEGSMAWGINNAGYVVGHTWRWRADGSYISRAFLYDPIIGTMLDLNDLIPDGSGWILTGASDINDAGQIVGEGMVAGSLQAFLLNPQPRDIRS